MFKAFDLEKALNGAPVRTIGGAKVVNLALNPDKEAKFRLTGIMGEAHIEKSWTVDGKYYIDCDSSGFDLVMDEELVMAARPAFPLPQGANTIAGTEGMLMRDYFAGQVIGAVFKDYWDDLRVSGRGCDAGWSLDLAMGAYQMADAMLQAREEQVGHVR